MYFKENFVLEDIEKISFSFDIPSLIFLNGDLGTGKTTLVKKILKTFLGVTKNIVSPTYSYYNIYEGVFNGKKINIYHFDLYKLNNYDEFFNIGAEDIFDNNKGLIFVEWPDVIKTYYKGDYEIFLNLDIFGKRTINIEKNK